MGSCHMKQKPILDDDTIILMIYYHRLQGYFYNNKDSNEKIKKLYLLHPEYKNMYIKSKSNVEFLKLIETHKLCLKVIEKNTRYKQTPQIIKIIEHNTLQLTDITDTVYKQIKKIELNFLKKLKNQTIFAHFDCLI